MVYFVVGPVIATFLLSGIWRTEGMIIIGLMGPLLGFVFFLKRRWAVALFLIYSGLVLGLAVLEPRLDDSEAALLAEIHPGYDLGRMASRLNDFVFKSSDSRSFITFFFGELDRRTGEMRFINAGHNPPFVLRREEGESVAHKSSGFALGMFPGAIYEPGTVRCGPGDLAAELCRKIIEDARGFRYETQPCDDITLVILKRADETSA